MPTQQILGQGLFTLAFKGDTNGVNQFANSLKAIPNSVKSLNMSMTQYKSGAEKMSIAVKQQESGVNGLSKSLDAASHEMFHAAAAAGALSAGMMMMGKSITDSTYNFDRQMSMVKATTGATTEEMGKMSTAAREVGRSGEYGAAKAAEALLVLARMGLNAKDSMTVLTPAMKLAQTQQYDLASGTTMVIQQLKVFGEGMDKAEKYANVLAATSSQTATDLEGLKVALGYTAPVAAIAGRSIEEISAALGMMSNAGIEASTQGTSLRMAMIRMVKPTREVKEGLKQIGLNEKDVDIQTKTLSEVFTKLSEGSSKVSNKVEVLSKIFGVRAVPAMAAILEQINRNSTAFDNMVDSITGTNAVAEQFDTQMQSFSGQMNLMGTAIQDMAIEFGQTLIPILTYVSSGVQSLSASFRALPDAIKQILSLFGQFTIGGTAMIAAMAAIGYGVAQMGKIIISASSFFNGINNSFNTFTQNNKIAKAEMLAFNTALNGSVAAAANKAMANRYVIASDRELIIQEALKRASIEKTTAAQFAAFQAEMKLQILQKRGIIANVDKINAATRGATTLALANTGLTVSTNAAVPALARMGLALKGLFNAMGGIPGLIITLAVVALPALITSILNLNAAKEKEEKQFVDTYKEYGTQIEQLNRMQVRYDEISKSTDDYATKVKKLTALEAEMGRVRRQLEVDSFGYVESIDFLTNEFKLNTKALEEQIKKYKELAVKKVMETRKQEGKPVTEVAARFLVEREEIENIKDYNSLIIKQDFAQRDLDKTMNTLYDTMGKLNQNSLLSMDAIKGLLPEMIRLDAEMSNSSRSALEAKLNSLGLNESQKELMKSTIKWAREANFQDKLLKLITNRMIDVKNETNGLKTPTDSATDGLGGLGDAAGKTVKDLDSLLDMIERLKKDLEDVGKEYELDIKMTGLSDIEKGYEEINKKIEKQTSSMTDKLQQLQIAYTDALAKKGETNAKGELLISEEEFKKAESALVEFSSIYASTYDKLMVVQNVWKNEYTKKVLKTLQTETKSAYDDLENMQIEYNGNFISNLQDMNSKTFSEWRKNDLKILGEMIILNEQLNSAQKDPAVKVGQESKLKILVEEKNQLIKIRDLQLSLNKVEAKRIESQQINKMKSSKYGGTTETLVGGYLNVKEVENYTMGILQANGDIGKSYQDMGKVSQQAISELIVTQNEWGKTVSSTAADIYEEFTNIVAKISDASDEMKETLGGITGMMSAAASGDYLGAILQFLENFTNVLTDAMNQEKEWNAKIQEEEEARIKKLAEADEKLYFAVNDLRYSFIEFNRQLLGLGTSAEDVSEMLVSSLSGIRSTLYTYSQGLNWATTEGITTDKSSRSYGVPRALTATELVAATTTWTDRSLEAFKSFIDDLSIDVLAAWSETPQDFIDLFSGGTINQAMTNFLDSLSPEQRIRFNEGGGAAAQALVSAGEITDAIEYVTITLVNKMRGELYGGLDALFADNKITKEELISSLSGIVDTMKTYAGRTVQIDGKDISLVNADDLLNASNKLFEHQLASAFDPTAVNQAFDTLAGNLQYVLTAAGGTLFQQLSPDKQIDLLDRLAEIDVKRQDELNNLSSKQIESTKVFEESAGKIVDAFNKGIINYAEASGALNRLSNTIGDFPLELQNGLRDVIRDATITLMSAQKTKAEQLAGIPETIAGDTKSFLENLKNINEEMNDVIKGWTDLIAERQNIISTYESESAKLREDSADRIDALQAERDATLGLFDFSETQSVRSQRFAKAREIEKNIIDEIIKTNQELLKLTENYRNDIADVDAQLQELIDEYGSIDLVYTTFAAKRKTLEDDYIAQLKEQIELAKSLGATIDERIIPSLQLASSMNLLSPTVVQDVVDLILGGVRTAIANSPDLSALPGLQSQQTAQARTQVPYLSVPAPTPISGPTPIAPTVSTVPNFNVRTAPAPIKPKPTIVPNFSIPKIPLPTNPLDILKNILNPFGAAEGFKGIVKKPTTFMAGEGNQPELVNITPVSDLAKMGNNIGSSAMTNIHIHEHIDMRGAYGISSPEVARKVWKDVWAPARRKSVNNIIDMRGRIQR